MNKIIVTSHSRMYQLYLRDEADASVAAEIFKEREYRVAEEMMKTAVDPILDVGAHSGMFTMYARSINPTVRIIDVEPEPNNVELLRRHILENRVQNIEVIEAALSGDSGRRKLLVSEDSHNHRLLPADDKGVSPNALTVEALSLPDLLKKCIISAIGLLKMDIEGSEFEVFSALTADDLSKIKAVLLEYHNTILPQQEIEEKLRENGFSVQRFPSRFEKTMGFIFALNKRV